MSFKEVATLDADITLTLGGSNRKTGKQNPKQVEGYYLGSRQVSSPKSKNGKAYLHFFQTAKGNVGVWGKTDLDRKVLTAPLGTMVRVTQTGMQATPNGEMYKFKVELDNENTIEVDAAVTFDAASNESEYGETTDYAGSDDDASTEEEQDAPPVRSAGASAEERKQRTQALFKNRKAN